MPSPSSNHWISPLAIKACTVAGIVHLAALCGFAWWHGPLELPELGSRGLIRIRGSWSPPRPTGWSGTVSLPGGSPTRVVVGPTHASIGQRRFSLSHDRSDPPSFAAATDPESPLPAAGQQTSSRSGGTIVLSQISGLNTTAEPPPVVSIDAVAEAPPLSASDVRSIMETLASLKDNPPPIYPAEAARRRIEGETLLRVRIGADGRVVDVKVFRTSGYPVLDGAAVAGVKQWRGEPARIGGYPVEITVRVPVRFQLRENDASQSRSR